MKIVKKNKTKWITDEVVLLCFMYFFMLLPLSLTCCMTKVKYSQKGGWFGAFIRLFAFSLFFLFFSFFFYLIELIKFSCSAIFVLCTWYSFCFFLLLLWPPTHCFCKFHVSIQHINIYIYICLNIILMWKQTSCTFFI